jgi:hypothetical protein
MDVFLDFVYKLLEALFQSHCIRSQIVALGKKSSPTGFNSIWIY